MKNRFMQIIVGTFLGLLMLFGGTQLVSAQDGEGKGRSLEGVWRTVVTPRNCVTGVPIPTAAFKALLTFHKGGTLSAWFQNSTITVTRGPSHGLWQSDHGWSDYSFKFVHLRYHLTTGEFRGKQESGGTLVLGVSGDEFTTEGFTTVFDVNGNPIGGGCSTSAGVRFKLD
ncbi:MAG: hypothetical protein WKF92_15110 [Pyrinomonadaceae bacterium]